MDTHRAYIVDADDNSNIGVIDISAGPDDDVLAMFEEQLESGQAIDQVVGLTPPMTGDEINQQLAAMQDRTNEQPGPPIGGPT